MKILTPLVAAWMACASLPAFAAEQAGDAVTATAAPAARYLDTARELAIHALALIGVKYRYGSDSPDEGFDCSGLVSHVVQEVTGIVLPRSSQSMSRVGRKVEKAELEPGDLVFFNTRRRAYSHVGIYIGDARFVHAARYGREVEVSDMRGSYWRQRYNGARRVNF